MSKPGAQEYYDRWIQMLADYGIDALEKNAGVAQSATPDLPLVL